MAVATDPELTVMLTFRVTETDKALLERACELEDRKVADVLRRALRSYIDRVTKEDTSLKKTA